VKTILFVEDDPIIIQVYRGALQNGGYQVEVAEDGLVAMKIILQLRPDLVVLDIVMPKVDGAYVLNFIRSRPELKATKVILLSSATNADIARDVLAQNPDQVFSKSNATPKVLLKAIKGLLEGDAPAQQPAS
jgi:CheY-like chemotaxis protein